MRHALLVMLVGCGGPDLSGKWSGTMNCGDNEGWEVAFRLTENQKGNFAGPGAAGVVCDVVDEFCVLDFDITVKPNNNSNEQRLDVVMKNCSIQYDGQDWASGCYTPRFFALQDSGTINGYFDNCKVSVN